MRTFHIRWRIANFLLGLAFRVAPRGPVRTMYLNAIDEISKEIVWEVINRSPGPNEKIKAMARRYQEVQQARREIEEQTQSAMSGQPRVNPSA
jgi:hypothetical protein